MLHRLWDLVKSPMGIAALLFFSVSSVVIYLDYSQSSPTYCVKTDVSGADGLAAGTQATLGIIVTNCGSRDWRGVRLVVTENEEIFAALFQSGVSAEWVSPGETGWIFLPVYVHFGTPSDVYDAEAHLMRSNGDIFGDPIPITITVPED